MSFVMRSESARAMISPSWPRHLLGVKDLPLAVVEGLVQSALAFKTAIPADVKAQCQGKTLINLFLENSTRTRISFELAALRLGMHVVNMSVDGSSLLKGESFSDTVETLAAMRPDVLVIRATQNDAAAEAARHVESFGVSVINAGNGTNEHPTQALLDFMTLREAKGSVKGLKVVICGDIRHSRVARSNAWLLSRAGARIVFAGPSEFWPDSAIWPDSSKGEDGWDMPGISWTEDFDDALSGADIVITLRIQKERLSDQMNISLADYQQRYRLDHVRYAQHAPQAVVMNPGPMMRDVEITGALADDPEKSLILRQVENGVFMRAAVLAAMLKN